MAHGTRIYISDMSSEFTSRDGEYESMCEYKVGL